MKQLIGLLIGVFVTGMAALYAMPERVDLDKARPLIQELMADDFAALKIGKKNHEAVGDAAMKLLESAETEAAKYLLCKSAFGLYIRGKSYDKAADVLEAFQESISDLPPADLVELIQVQAKGIRGKDAPKLFAAYRALQSKANVQKERDRAQAALADNPTDVTLRRTYAEWCAQAGDWKAALASFSKLDGDFAKVVQNETADRIAAADFWWNYEPVVRSSLIKNSSDAFKRHAVMIYKRSLKEGALTGLKRSLAEKRIAQFEVTVATMKSPSSSTKVINSPKYDSRSYVQKGLIAQWDGIDNAGVGRHLNRMSVWKDLKGSGDIVLRPSAKIESNHIYCDGASYAGILKKKYESSKIVSVEFVFEFISASANSCLFSTGGHTKESYDRFFGYINGRKWFMFGNYVIGPSRLGKMQMLIDFEAEALFSKGVKYGSMKKDRMIPKTERGFDFYIGGYLDSAVKCRLFALRFYDRRLTDEEMKKNAMIDCVRFGLE